VSFAFLRVPGGICSPAQDETPDKRLRNATETLHEVMATPDKAIPRGLLNHSRCLVVVPGMKKAAFIVCGQYGRGFALCRSQWGWSAPAPVRLAGGSFGIQLGADSTDTVMLVMNERGMNRLRSDKFAIGADASVAAGPVGRDTAANTGSNRIYRRPDGSFTRNDSGYFFGRGFPQKMNAPSLVAVTISMAPSLFRSTASTSDPAPDQL